MASGRFREEISRNRHYFGLALSLGWQDVRDTYQRSVLGPFWLTIGLAVQVSAIGLVFGFLFGAKSDEFFPFLAISLTTWSFLVGAITEASGAYVQSQNIVKQMYAPSFLPVVRVLSKNLIIFVHNLSLVAVVMASFGIQPTIHVFLAIPGLLVLTFVVFNISTVFATVSARFRDVPPILSSILLLSFYLTPVIWMPDSLPENLRGIILTWNPLFHMMELVRAPILGLGPSGLNWIVSTGFLVAAGGLAAWVSKKYSWKIVYWL